MKKILLGTVALIALGTASAFAADLPARTYTKAPAYVPAPIYNWTGFYIGGHVGGAFAGNSSFGNNDGRFLGGVQVGADYQFAPNWVLGIEGQYPGPAVTPARRRSSRVASRSTIAPATSARSLAVSATPGARPCCTPRAVLLSARRTRFS